VKIPGCLSWYSVRSARIALNLLQFPLRALLVPLEMPKA
jgi:hypothetical protein